MFESVSCAMMNFCMCLPVFVTDLKDFLKNIAQLGHSKVIWNTFIINLLSIYFKTHFQIESGVLQLKEQNLKFTV